MTGIPSVAGLEGFTDVEPGAIGGSSQVFRAFQPDLNRLVAIKLLGMTAADRSVRDRFDREMSVTGSLGAHPHIVDIFERGICGTNQPYVVMPWYDGGSLADAVRRGPMRVAPALRLGVKLSSALAFAHAHGVLHRDVKPGNVLFSRLGEPVLADFGIAVLMRDTGSATMAWTPVHAAPEVLRYEPATESSDLWSLASTLYTALAGRPPFPMDDDRLRSLAARRSPPPFVSADIPDSLYRLLAAALARDAADRPAGAGALAAGLQAIQSELGLPGTEIIGAEVVAGPAGGTVGGSVRGAGDGSAGSVMVDDVTLARAPKPRAPAPRRRFPAIDRRLPAPRAPDPPDDPGDLTVVRDPPVVRRGWSLRRRLITAVASGLTTAVLLVGVLAVVSPPRSPAGSPGPADASPGASPAAKPRITGVHVTDRTSSTISMAWDDDPEGVNPHLVLVPGREQPEVAGRGTRFTVSGLQPDTQYCLTVVVLYSVRPVLSVMAPPVCRTTLS